MKKICLLIPVLFFVFCLAAQPPEGPAEKGMTFGTNITAEGALTPNEVPVALKEKAGMPIKIKGKVVEVCKAEGCWLKMETASGTMMIRMKDHAFFVPVSMSGKTIVAEGTATYKEISVEMLKHYAEDAGKSKDEIAAIAAPKTELTMQATGILVL